MQLQHRIEEILGEGSRLYEGTALYGTDAAQSRRPFRVSVNAFARRWSPQRFAIGRRKHAVESDQMIVTDSFSRAPSRRPT